MSRTFDLHIFSSLSHPCSVIFIPLKSFLDIVILP